MENSNKEKDQEYNRIQQELMSRIKMCYSDGAMLASFCLVYYATIIAGLIQILQIDCEDVQFLLFGLISPIAFFFPIIILHTFAVKFKENFAAVCNIAAFSFTYYEKPGIVKSNSIEGIKWELMHKNSLAMSTRHESKEYFLLALTSFFFLVASFVFSIFIYVNKFDSIEVGFLLLIIIIYCVAFIMGSIFLYKIYSVTSLFKLSNIMDDTKLFYEIQSEKFSPEEDKQPCNLLKEILDFKNDENMLNLFLYIKRIPDYNATEIIKLFYGRIKSEKYSKEIKSRNGKELIKNAEKYHSIHDYIIEYVKEYLNKHKL